MNASLIVEDVIESLRNRYGKYAQVGKSRLLRFGSALTCSINFSRPLRGDKYFFGLARDVVDPDYKYPETSLGDFVLLACGTMNNVLFIPRSVVLDMMKGVATRRLDVFLDGSSYILQTTGHTKIDVTEYLNAFPSRQRPVGEEFDDARPKPGSDRRHLKIQWALIQLGRAEGCSVWVPPNDRSLSYLGHSLSGRTVERLPNFGFEENTRRIVQNIDVLWMTRNIIDKAFEIEATTTIYSGLLRMNDLVLSQPNNRIDLYVATTKARRDRVRAQMMRPSFQTLATRCQYLAFEFIEEQYDRLETFSLGSETRVSGLIRGEKFELSDHPLYPEGL